MTEPVMRGESELQLAHDILGMAVCYGMEEGFFESEREQAHVSDLAKVLCWCLGHTHRNEFGELLQELAQRLRAVGYLKTEAEMRELKEAGNDSRGHPGAGAKTRTEPMS